jgi:group I intron endonuclease
LRKNRHRNSHLQNAFNKYGESAFSFRAVLFCDAENLLFYEQACIDGMNPEYNKAIKAEAPMQGRRHTEETRKKMSEVAAGRVFSEETRKKMSEAKVGKPNGRLGSHLTEETKRKLSVANSGEKNCRFGVSLSEETKRKMSEKMKAYRKAQRELLSGGIE